MTQAAGDTFTRLPPEMKKQIKETLKSLGENPYAGKQLRNELALFRTIKIKRFRAIYMVDDNSKTIIVIAIGHRMDIYEIASALVK